MIICYEEDGRQHLFHIDRTGDYTGNGVVLWLEKVDGPFPENLKQYVGGLVRVGNEIQFDQAKYDAYLASKESARLSQIAFKANLRTRRNRLRNFVDDSDPTAAEVKQAVKDLIFCFKHEGKEEI